MQHTKTKSPYACLPAGRALNFSYAKALPQKVRGYCVRNRNSRHAIYGVVFLRTKQ